MKEIGGYFGLEEGRGNKEFYPSLIKLNLGRNALAYVLRARKIRKLYIPYFLCDTVYLTCKRENVEYEFYKVNKDFTPIFYKKLNSDEFLYVVNYYGQLSNRTIKIIKRKYQNIILDNVQAFFQKPVKNIDTIYSCRKFFGVPDGAYLHTKVQLDEKLLKDDSSARTKHLFGRNIDGASSHYNEYVENEKKYYSLDLKIMSNFSQNLLKKMNYKNIRKQRTKNFKFLNKSLGNINLIKPKNVIGGYSYPLVIENAETIRANLIKNSIFIPRLWPDILDNDTQEFSNKILPIPCDQRYSKEEMSSIVKEIKLCLKN